MLHINFLPGGNAKQFLANGWAVQEPIGIWAIGMESSLLLPPVPLPGAYRLSIKLFPMIHHPIVVRQRLELIVNGRAVHIKEIEKGDTGITCIISDGLLNAHVHNTLVILHPDAQAPKELSPNRDCRLLSVCFRTLDLANLGAPDTKDGTVQSLMHAPGPLPGASTSRALVFCVGGTICGEISKILECFPLFDIAVELRVAKNVDSCIEKVKALSAKDRTRLIGVWQQVFEADNDASNELRTHVPKSAVYIRFPHLSINCLWPLQGSDSRLIPETSYPGGRYPLTDIAGFQLHGDSLRLDDDNLYEAYLKLSMQLMPDLKGEWQRDESRCAALDSFCDVKVADFIRKHFARQRLFCGPESPCAPILLYIAEHLLGSVLSRLQLRPSEVFRDFSNYVHGYQGMFYDQAPIHPYVLEFFKVPGVSPEFLYRREFSKRTFREHILDYIRWAPWFAGGRAAGE